MLVKGQTLYHLISYPKVIMVLMTQVETLELFHTIEAPTILNQHLDHERPIPFWVDLFVEAERADC